MVIVLGVYVFAVYSFVSRNASEALNQQLRQDFVWVYAGLYQTPDGDYMLNEPQLIDPEAMLPWVQVWRGDRSLVVFRNAEADRNPLPEARLIVGEGITTLGTGGERMRILTERGDFRVARGAFADVRVVIQIARPEAPMRAQMRNLAVLLALGLPLAVLVAGVGGYVLARRALAPIERMTDHARTITAERLNDRLPVADPEDEMGRLAAVFNETLARLEQSFDQMRRFTADVSHQLRTPLTAIRSVGEVGLRGGHRNEAEYRSIIASMLEETDRLAVLVNRLLTLSRTEMRQSMSPEPLNLRDLADDVVGHLGVLAEEKGQTLSVESEGVPMAVGDRVVLRQALVNLVDNAIKFTPPGGDVRIHVADVNGSAVVDVTDTGPGIPEDVKPRIFDRFYRGDTGAESGTGLGLSIAKGAVEANGGDLTLYRSGPAGTRFRITLPRSPRSSRQP
jgi:heavy metal sensor kinase